MFSITDLAKNVLAKVEQDSKALNILQKQANDTQPSLDSFLSTSYPSGYELKVRDAEEGLVRAVCVDLSLRGARLSGGYEDKDNPDLFKSSNSVSVLDYDSIDTSGTEAFIKDQDRNTQSSSGVKTGAKGPAEDKRSETQSKTKTRADTIKA